MYKQNVRLQNADKTHRCYISSAEAARLVAKGSAVRVTGKKINPAIFRMKSFPGPSNSRQTACELTQSDMLRVSGLKTLTEMDVERLIGHGLIQSPNAFHVTFTDPKTGIRRGHIKSSSFHRLRPTLDEPAASQAS